MHHYKCEGGEEVQKLEKHPAKPKFKCGRSEINTTKEMSENVVQPGIEPGSPDYRSDALTTLLTIYIYGYKYVFRSNSPGSLKQCSTVC